MYEVVFELGGIPITLRNVEDLKYGEFLGFTYMRCEVGPKTPKTIRIKKDEKEILCFKFLFKLKDIFIGRKA